MVQGILQGTKQLIFKINSMSRGVGQPGTITGKLLLAWMLHDEHVQRFPGVNPVCQRVSQKLFDEPVLQVPHPFVARWVEPLSVPGTTSQFA